MEEPARPEAPNVVGGRGQSPRRAAGRVSGSAGRVSRRVGNESGEGFLVVPWGARRWACGVPGSAGLRVSPSPSSSLERVWESRVRGWWLAAKPAWVDPGWYDAPLRPEVRHLLLLEPGSLLVAALAKLPDPATPCPADHSGELGLADAPIGVTGSPCACMVVVAAAWEAAHSWTATRAKAALLGAAGEEPVEVPAQGVRPRLMDPAREELATALRVSPASMANRLHSARVGSDIRDLDRAAAAGVWSAWTARLLSRDLAHVPLDTARRITVLLATKVMSRHRKGLRPWTGSEVRRACARLVARHAPGAAAAAKRRARAGRRVELDSEGNGMSRLTAVLETVDAVRIHRRLTAVARGLDDPVRTLDQKRADTLTDLLLAPPTRGASEGAGCGADSCTGESDCAGDCGAAAHSCSGVPQIHVIVTLPALMGLTQEPAEVPGVGPIDADSARQLAADGQWRAWLVDAAGAVTAVGTRRYTPSPALARLVRSREPVCRMPGCTRAAEACDLDHTVPHPRGATEAANLGPLCRRHHNMKTHHRWRLANTERADSDADAAYTWCTPAGITITDGPPPPLGYPDSGNDPPDSIP